MKIYRRLDYSLDFNQFVPSQKRTVQLINLYNKVIIM